jgi:hypothetical protein
LNVVRGCALTIALIFMFVGVYCVSIYLLMVRLTLSSEPLKWMMKDPTTPIVGICLLAAGWGLIRLCAGREDKTCSKN